jgi:hypothetical protein
MSRASSALIITVLAIAGLGVTCPSASHEITRERAIAIAEADVSFQITSVNAERVVDNGVRVWRVTIQGQPASPDHPLLRPILIVLIDVRTGEIVSVAKS